MKHLLRLIYKIGKLTHRIPKPTTEPFIKMKDAYMSGRHDGKVITKVHNPVSNETINI